MKILTLIQARTGSSRLPNKVLLPILEKTLLERMMERVERAKSVGRLVVATTTETDDDPIEALCKSNDWECFRGHPTDLLDRHYQAAVKYGADAVSKIPSDCPLIDPSIIDRVHNYFVSHADQIDFVSNLHPPTYPDGNDVEIMSFGSLERAWKEAKRPMEREHTTPYIWENPQDFRIENLAWESGRDLSMSHRFTIDYPEDYEFIRSIFEELHPKNPSFGLDEILSLLEEKPEIYKINEKFAGVNWYRNHLDELKTIDSTQTRQIEKPS